MRNFSHAGRTCTFIAPYALYSGQGFQVGSMFAVANGDAAQGAQVEGDCEGVLDLTKAAGAGTAAVAGTKLYWDNAARTVTKAAGAGANLFIGHCLKDAVDGDVVFHLRLHGAPA